MASSTAGPLRRTQPKPRRSPLLRRANHWVSVHWWDRIDVNYSCIAIGCWVRSRMLKTSCRRRGSRAWEKRATLMSPASYRAWLYRIATNLCLTTLARAPRRSLPPETRPQRDPGSPLSPRSREPIWLEPFPDDLLADQHTDPEDRALRREHLTLAFLMALQH